MKNTSIIQVEKLVKTYSGKNVVNGVSFDVMEGEIFGILGPNGAGKSTILEMIETLRKIDSGKVTLDGIDVAKDPKKVKKIIGIQLQNTAFMEKLNLNEQLRMFASFYGVSINTRALLESVNLLEHAKKYPEQLSGGQRQRFAIASALVNTPRVLFLDEPTTGLDPQARRNLWELVQDIKKRGITVVLTTHYMEEAELLCDRLAIMDEGEIKVIDSPKNLIQALLDRGFKKTKVIQEADLEDVFIDLTGKELRD
ncbi:MULTISPECIES: ABC transporter ATP-binding protein [Streptococcus]|uniref:Multidrug ABC transporter ATPase n=1 Tax=Streptococcus downei MFe28 TaxID=764290 RepID=A0A380JF42_STRDO|nr:MULTISPECIES: ABC transporter ATP-binding protein [Streptococcus]EFQ56633.1 ABC transporter, ATP-binding protein [Streptococcus downei F0415]SUN36017.1 multidrug ABC transporter ATPase [Streptococcus downei MFe28]